MPRLPQNGARDYRAPRTLPADSFAFSGRWQISDDAAVSPCGATLRGNVQARRIYLVAESARPRTLAVLLDGRIATRVRVGRHAVYTLADLGTVQRRRLTLRAPAGLRAFAISFAG